MEYIALLWTVLLLRPFIECARFKTWIDHHALCWIFNLTNPSQKLERWHMGLSRFEMMPCTERKSIIRQKRRFCYYQTMDRTKPLRMGREGYLQLCQPGKKIGELQLQNRPIIRWGAQCSWARTSHSIGNCSCINWVYQIKESWAFHRTVEGRAVSPIAVNRWNARFPILLQLQAIPDSRCSHQWTGTRSYPTIPTGVLSTYLSLLATTGTPRILHPVRHNVARGILATNGKRCRHNGERLLPLTKQQSEEKATWNLKEVFSQWPGRVYRHENTWPIAEKSLWN